MTEPDTPPIEADPPPPARRRSARAVGMAAVLVAALVGVYAAFWISTDRSIRDGIQRWIAEQAARGVEVGHDGVDVTGFPFWLEVRMTRPEARWRRPRPGSWRAPEIVARLRPWNLTSIDFFAPGRHEVSGRPDAVLAMRWFGGRIDLGRRGAFDVRVEAEGVGGEIAGAGEVGLKRLALDVGWRGGRGEAATPLSFDLGLDGYAAPARWASPLGREVQTLRLAGHVTGELGDSRDPDMLLNWRNGGGTLEITAFAVAHGPARLSGSGTFALDAEMQPEGAATARIEGFNETVDALVQVGILQPGAATAAKLVLTVMAKRPAGQAPYVEAPLTLQDRKLSIDRLTLLRAPRVDWTRVLGP